MKTPEQYHWRRSANVIANFEHVSLFIEYPLFFSISNDLMCISTVSSKYFPVQSQK